MSVCFYPAVKALAVRAGPSEVDVRVLADLIQGLGLAGNTFQIHHGNVTTLDKHLQHTTKQDQRQIAAIPHRWVFGCCRLVTDEQWGANHSKTKASIGNFSVCFSSGTGWLVFPSMTVLHIHFSASVHCEKWHS